MLLIYKIIIQFLKCKLNRNQTVQEIHKNLNTKNKDYQCQYCGEQRYRFDIRSKNNHVFISATLFFCSVETNETEFFYPLLVVDSPKNCGNEFVPIS